MIGLFGHDFSNSNTHYFTSECKFAMMALAQNPDFTIKYVYHEEFHNETLEPININESSIYEFITDKKPLCYHVYNMKRNKHYQNNLPFSYKIYNLSAIKMHQLAQHVGGCVRDIFNDAIAVENVRISKISESNIQKDAPPRTKKFIHEKPEKKVFKKNQ